MSVKVLKLTGMGRTGSTVLGITLGNHPDIENVGEVGSIIRTGWISRKSLRGIDPKRLTSPRCICGKRLDVLYVDAPVVTCPFWSSVRREWIERTERVNIESFPELQDAFELKRRWPRLLHEKRKPSDLFRLYARLTLAFFESIRASSGKSIIVDASTIPIRTFVLGMIPGIDLYVVHLVRDGRAIVASSIKHTKEPRQSTIYRNYTTIPTPDYEISNVRPSAPLCIRLGPRRTMRLRYEDFAGDPKAALERIGSLIEVDVTDVANAASSGQPMQVGHPIGGSRTSGKRSGTITLRPDTEEWKTDLFPTEQRLSWMLMGWFMRRYGYDR